MGNLRDVNVVIEETTTVETVDTSSLCFLLTGSDKELKPTVFYDATYVDQIAKLETQYKDNSVLVSLLKELQQYLENAFSTQSNLRKKSILCGIAEDGYGEYPASYSVITSDKFTDTTNGANNTNAQFVLHLNEGGKGTSTYTATDVNNKQIKDIKDISWTQNKTNIIINLGTDTGSGADLPKIILKRNDDLKTFTSEDGILYSLGSTYPMTIKTTIWTDFFSERDTDLSKFFGFLAVLNDTAMMSSYTSLVNYCTGQEIPVFYCAYVQYADIKNIEANEFFIPFIHKQIYNKQEVNNLLMEVSLPILCYRLQNDPNTSTYTTLSGISNLSSNTYTLSERQEIENAHVNQYYKKHGLTRFRIGVVSSGRKIEEMYCLKTYIPYDMQERLEEFQDNAKLKQGDQHKFEGCLDSILSSYEANNILTKTQILGNKAYSIDTITTKMVNNIAEFDATIRVAYNNNIVNINITGKEVEVVLSNTGN